MEANDAQVQCPGDGGPVIANRTRRRSLWLSAPLMSICASAHAELRIQIIPECFPPPAVAIAIADLRDEPLQLRRVGMELSNQVAKELADSGMFRSIPSEAFVQKPEDSATRPEFDDWRMLNASVLVTGRTAIQAEGSLLVDATVWDVMAEREMTSVVIATAPEYWSDVAHRVADAVYRRIVGTSIPRHGTVLAVSSLARILALNDVSSPRLSKVPI